MQVSPYTLKDSGLHRLHPITKLAIAGFFLFASLLLPGLWWTFGAWVVLALPLAFWGRIVPPFLKLVLIGTLPFALSIFLIQGFLWPEGTPIWTIGPVSLKAEGLAFTIRFVGRIILLNSAFLLLALSTRPDALMQALVQIGMPHTVAYTVLTTMQIAPRFQAKANTILDAQRSRGLEMEGGIIQRAKALIPLLVPLVLGSIVDVEERAIALEARGFSRKGAKTTLYDLYDTKGQRIARWALLIAITALAALQIAAALL